MRPTTPLSGAALAALLVATPAIAQPLGSFTWQLQPFCNTVTVSVVQTGGVYALDGFDDQCGGANPRAPLVGVAVINPDGSLGFGLNIVTNPGASPIHVRATLVLPATNGTWSDSAGNSGAFTFGGGVPGNARPAPAGLSAAALTVAGAGSIAGALAAGSVSSGTITATGAGTFDSLVVTNQADIGGAVTANSLFARSGFVQSSLFSSSASGAPSVEFLRGRGTANGMALPLNGDTLASISFKGVTNPAGGFRSGALIQAATTENWSFTGSGARLTFSTNPNNSNATVPRMLIDHNGEVGIGTSTPDQLLSVNGNASKVGGGSWAVFSDERLKNLHGTFRRGLAEVMQLQPIRYEYKADNPLGLRGHGEYIGFSAQAVKAVIPEAVDESRSGYLQLNADPILWTMLNAVKELKAENDDLRARLAALEAAVKKP